MAAEVGLKCEVYGADKIKELKMGAFWSVAQGSDEPPTLIVLRYEPAGAPEKPVLGLVGKGITFDTGGISIKPSDGMEKMKYDMAGGATMIGAMRAIALLKPKLKITAIILATENMPSGKAQKPGDVQIAMSGKSIEIINTDAEGRLVLADGLHYARQLGCTHLIDAATLTGAVVVALGSINAGIFANDDAMYNRFSQALDKAGEKMWRLPLDDEYLEIIRSNIADIVNSGGRWGGAITAAMFLKEFAEDTPWLHLDIAGTAWTEEQKPWIAKGPSGIALRSLVEFSRDFADSKEYLREASQAALTASQAVSVDAWVHALTFSIWRLSMKALFGVGLAIAVLGILSFFIAFPHTENHGIKAGDVNIGVQTHDSQKVSPAVSAVMLVVGAGLMIAGRGKN